MLFYPEFVPQEDRTIVRSPSEQRAATLFLNAPSIGDIAHHTYKHNTSRHLPYHNHNHALCMVGNVIEGAFAHQLTVDQTKQLVIAAIMHDVNHTGGRERDVVNIARAQSFWWYTYTNFNFNNWELYTGVQNLISATEYPYTREAVTITERIIRDADMMQFIEPEGYLWCVHALGEEMKHSFETLTEYDMVCKTIDFQANHTMLTEWGDSKRPQVENMIGQLLLRKLVMEKKDDKGLVYK